MCGIIGFNWDDSELAKRMTSSLIHRGPDASGHFIDENISLGHRRLSIIDLSEAGTQPMSSDENTVHITFNGEIYNFKELRKILEKEGYKFNSKTDTEVILHGYSKWGKDIVSKLNGQFAFAIWDSKNKTLFLARDRLGIKPLYYYWNPKTKQFLFASEIKAILQHSEVKREVNKNATFNYLNIRYIPGEETLFQNIKKLLPGHYMILKENRLTISQFWNIPLPNIKQNNNATKEVHDLLHESVKKRLVADVPVGVYLSGGLDSSAITALASQIKQEPVKTFSVGFENSEADELHKARVIADHFNTDHHEINNNNNISELLPTILWHLDMPHGDPVVIPQFKLSELASKKVKVVLSGEGADEIYGGYVQYQKMLQAQKLKFIPQPLAKAIPIPVLDKLFNYPSSIGEKGKEKFIDLFAKKQTELQQYQQFTSILSNNDQKQLHLQKLENKQLQQHWQKSRKPIINRMLYYDSKTWLPNYVLHINDRMTMSHSIEGRVPFLDHNIVEHATTLDPKFKKDKIILKQAMSKLLPKNNNKKHPFLMPLDRWYKEELKDLTEQLFTLSSVKKRGYFNYHHIQKIWQNYNSSKLLYGKQLFTFINFELWHRMFIDAEDLPQKNIKLNELL